MIGLNLIKPDFVPSLPKLPFKSIMMLPGRGMSAQEFRPVNRTKAREAEKTKAREEGGNVRRKESKLNSLEKVMSEKDNDINDERFLSNLNDVNQKGEMNDVEKSCVQTKCFVAQKILEK